MGKPKFPLFYKSVNVEASFDGKAFTFDTNGAKKSRPSVLSQTQKAKLLLPIERDNNHL